MTFFSRSNIVTLALVAGVAVVAGGTGATAGALITGKQIKDGTVTGADIRSSSVGGGDIANSSLSGADIRNSSLGGADVLDRSLLGVDIRDDTITEAHIKDESLTGVVIKDGSIHGLDITNGSINDNDIANNSINGDKIADGSLQPQEFAPGAFGAIAEPELVERYEAIPAKSNKTVQVQCPSNKVVMSGSPRWASGEGKLVSFPASTNTWKVEATNDSASPQNVIIVLVCVLTSH